MARTDLNNPLDEFFKTTPVEKDEIVVVEPQAETTGKMQTVYGAAMETFKGQIEIANMVDPKYAARNAEVAAQFLKIALDAAQAEDKANKDAGPKTVNNNLIVADRNDLLKQILGK